MNALVVALVTAGPLLGFLLVSQRDAISDRIRHGKVPHPRFDNVVELREVNRVLWQGPLSELVPIINDGRFERWGITERTPVRVTVAPGRQGERSTRTRDT